MRLVVRTRPAPTESLMGFVLRLTEHNGYPTTAFVLAAMGKEWYLPKVGRLDAAGLASLVGLGQGDIDRLTHKPAERPRAYVRVYGSDLPSAEVNLRRPKVCPACLAEGRPCEAFWDLAQAIVCPMHKVHLVSECPGCSKHLLWARSKVRQCKCGFDLTTAPVAPATPALAELMAFLRNKVYQDEGLAPLSPTMIQLAHLDLRRVCKLIWVMSGVVHHARGELRAPKARSHYREHLHVVAAALSNWPVGFREFLSSTYGDLLKNEQHFPRFHILFNWVLVRLIKNDKAGRSAFDFIEREIYQFGAQHWTRAMMTRDEKSKRLLPTWVRWGTMTETCQVTGLHQLTVKRRIASGEIKSRLIKRGKECTVVVDMDSVRSMRLTQRPAVSLRDAAPRIGVSIETLRALRSSGVFTEAYRSAYPDSLTHEDVEAFAERVRNLCRGRRAINASGVKTLDEAFAAWTASPKEKAELLARILAAPSMVVGKKLGEGVGRLQIREKIVSAYFQGVRGDAAACLPVLKTAARLGCSPAVVTWLKRAGHLKTRKHLGRDMPCLASVIEFEKRYEALARVADRLNLTSTAAYARLNVDDFCHVSVRTTQNSTVFVSRGELAKVERALRGAT